VDGSPVHHHSDYHDYQGLLLHKEAVRRMREDPPLVERALATLRRWMGAADPRKLPLLSEWKRILEDRDWDCALQASERGNELRRRSPMDTVLPPAVRMRILSEVYRHFRELDAERLSKRPQRQKTSSLILAARTASTSYREVVPATEVEAALMSGVVPSAWHSHLGTLLEEGPESLLYRVVEELHGKTGEPIDAILARMQAMAKELRCYRELWDTDTEDE
jgi:hypothetical protein